MDYYSKYLKYKAKYTALKKQLGGVDNDDIPAIEKRIANIVTQITNKQEDVKNNTSKYKEKKEKDDLLNSMSKIEKELPSITDENINKIKIVNKEKFKENINTIKTKIKSIRDCTKDK